MIYLKQDTVNNIALTLNEKNPLTGDTIFNFSIRHTDTNTQINFTGTDLSWCPYRFNRFLITLTGATYVDLSASTVNLQNGFHDYTVTNISGDTLETGMVLVSGTTVATPVFELPTTKTKKIYER
jgi:hypothetical protein